MKQRFRKSMGIILSVLMTMTMIPILPVSAASPQMLGDVTVYVGMTVNEVRSLLGREDGSQNTHGSGFLSYKDKGLTIYVDNVIDNEIKGNEKVVYQSEWSLEPKNIRDGYNTCLTINEFKDLIKRDQNIDAEIEFEPEKGDTNKTEVLIDNYSLSWYWSDASIVNEKSGHIECAALMSKVT